MWGSIGLWCSDGYVSPDRRAANPRDRRQPAAVLAFVKMLWGGSVEGSPPFAAINREPRLYSVNPRS
jgi:hypothetical protein